MARGLDGLICHLLDHIALCGEQGASPLDFEKYVKNYYHVLSEGRQTEGGDRHESLRSRRSPNIDRPFFEQVWKWLIKHPDIRLGDHDEHSQLTLPEVEIRNEATRQSERFTSAYQDSQNNGGLRVSSKPGPAESSQGVSGHQKERTIEPGRPSQKSSVEVAAITDAGDAYAPTNDQDGLAVQIVEKDGYPEKTVKPAAQPTDLRPIRLYTSDDRMWYALTGHGPDLNKVKALEFVCLSAIAISGPNGVLQHDLVRMSGQDKRSLPARTDCLHEAGYIVKERVSVEERNPRRILHTSRCTLKRFVDKPTDVTEPSVLETNNSVPADKRKGLDDGDKRARDGQEPPQVATDSSEKMIEVVPRLPQWTAGRPIGNQIFSLLDKSRNQGMSMSDIRETLFGRNVKKVTEDYMSRFVDCWQISQPLHLRHLSIVRDTILKGKSQIYIHYTLQNFGKLVEQGLGFWEAVKTVPESISIGRNVTADLNASPEVDEYGFPLLDESLFHGRSNDATLRDCLSTIKVGYFRSRFNHMSAKKEARRKSKTENTNAQKPQATRRIIRASKETDGLGSQGRSPSGTTLPSYPTINSDDHPNPIAAHLSAMIEPENAEAGASKMESQRQLGSKPRGRPRKYPRHGNPLDINEMTPEKIKRLHSSQKVAETYVRKTLKSKIAERTKDGEDPIQVTHDVLAEAESLREERGEEPLPPHIKAHILHVYAGGPAPEPAKTPKLPKRHVIQSRGSRKRKGQSDQTRPYWPSMSAHTIPVQSTQRGIRPFKALTGPRVSQFCDTLTSSTRKGVNPEKLPPSLYKYIPSIAAHSFSFLPLLGPSGCGSPKGNKAQMTSLLHGQDSQTADSSPTVTGVLADTINKPILRDFLATTEPVVDEGQYPGWKKFMAKNYSQQLDSIARTNDGIFIGRVTARRKRQCEPRGFRPICCQLAVFRFSRLKELNWFVDSQTSVPLPPSIAAQTQNHSFGERDPGVEQNDSSAPISQNVDVIPIGPESSITSQDAPDAKQDDGILLSTTRGTKRKRAVSPWSSQGEPTPDSPFPSPHPSYSLLRRGSFTTNKRMISSFDTICASDPDGSQADEINTSKDTGTHALPVQLGSDPLPSASTLQDFTVPGEQENGESSHDTRTPPVSSSVPVISNEVPVEGIRATPNKADSRPIPSNTPIILDEAGRETVNDKSHEPEGARPLSMITPDTLNAAEGQPPDRSHDAPPQTIGIDERPDKISTSRNKTSFGRMSRKGGSAAVLRRRIVMDIIAKCDGVFPSHREMALPFANEWSKRGQEGTPEAKTIQNAVDALCNAGELRRIIFTFQTRQGFHVTRSMLVRPSVDSTDPRVRKTQSGIMAHHPRNYIPRAVVPPDYPWTTDFEVEEADDASEEDSARKGQTLSRPKIARVQPTEATKKMMDGKAKAAKARLAMLELEEQTPDEPEASSGNLATGETVTNPLQAAATLIRKIPSIPKPYTDRRFSTTGQGSPSRKVVRLASITNRVKASIPTIPLPRATESSNSESNNLMWLPSEYAFSDFNYEDQRPTILEPATNNDTHLPHARYGQRLDAEQIKDSLASREHTKHRMRLITENAARIEQNQAKANRSRFSLSEYTSPYQGYTRRASDADSVSDDERNDFQPMRRSGQSAERSDMQDHLSKELGRISQLRKPAHSTIPWQKSSLVWFTESQGTISRRFLVNFMDPLHQFHEPSGTFSVKFMGLRPPRDIIGPLGTASCPYGLPLQRLSISSEKLEQSQFEQEINACLDWELNEGASQDLQYQDWPFQNHTFAHHHETVKSLGVDMDAAKEVTVRSEDGRLVSRKSKRIKGRRNAGFRTMSISPTTPKSSKRSKKRKRRSSLASQHDQEDDLSGAGQSDLNPRPTKVRKHGRFRETKDLSKKDEQRLLMAALVIRTVAGGLERDVDWTLVSKIFDQIYTQEYLLTQWDSIEQKYKFELPQIEADFQEKFLNGYERGSIPSLDYDNLNGYDWKWLIEWTMGVLDTNAKPQVDLPASRAVFDELYLQTDEMEASINLYYEIDSISNTAARLNAINHGAYVYPVEGKDLRSLSEEVEQLDTVKNWLRANNVTPTEQYDAAAAKAKLSALSEDLLEEAIQQLQADRILTQENKGRLIPGRNYCISEYFSNRLRKNLQLQDFRCAASYKYRLDLGFSEKGFVTYSPLAEDGDMLAIVNLIANQRITIRSTGIPADKWGQTDGSYKTRNMDKSRLDFSMELLPLSAYVPGFPLNPLPPPPCQHLQDSNAKIPLWYDFHGTLIQDMWDTTLAAALAVLSARSGVDAVELVKAFKPVLELWEVQSVLDWMIEAKIVTRVARGYFLEEWWWLALGNSSESLSQAEDDTLSINDDEKQTE